MAGLGALVGGTDGHLSYSPRVLGPDMIGALIRYHHQSEPPPKRTTTDAPTNYLLPRQPDHRLLCLVLYLPKYPAHQLQETEITRCRRDEVQSLHQASLILTVVFTAFQSSFFTRLSSALLEQLFKVQ